MSGNFPAIISTHVYGLHCCGGCAVIFHSTNALPKPKFNVKVELQQHLRNDSDNDENDKTEKQPTLCVCLLFAVK